MEEGLNKPRDGWGIFLWYMIALYSRELPAVSQSWRTDLGVLWDPVRWGVNLILNLILFVRASVRYQNHKTHKLAIYRRISTDINRSLCRSNSLGTSHSTQGWDDFSSSTAALHFTVLHSTHGLNILSKYRAIIRGHDLDTQILLIQQLPIYITEGLLGTLHIYQYHAMPFVKPPPSEFYDISFDCPSPEMKIITLETVKFRWKMQNTPCKSTRL